MRDDLDKACSQGRLTLTQTNLLPRPIGKFALSEYNTEVQDEGSQYHIWPAGKGQDEGSQYHIWPAGKGRGKVRGSQYHIWPAGKERGKMREASTIYGLLGRVKVREASTILASFPGLDPQAFNRVFGFSRFLKTEDVIKSLGRPGNEASTIYGLHWQT